MDLDPDLCYRAVRSRDRRFDGRFFTAVLTTGIYCRPICPAPTPQRRNVRFFACPSAAEEAGFRACLRCRPESSPGTPAWAGASATVSRALRLIAAGALDGEKLDALAARLGIGPRHLRRLFDAELGASPIAVAQTRRAHFARRLLDETGLPVTEIADIAGFGSIRRFNDVMRRSFGRPPRELRRNAPVPAAHEPAGALRLKLPFRPPYHWSAISRFLADRAIPGVERVEGSVYARTFECDGACGVVEISPRPGQAHLEMRVTVPPGALLEVSERARRMFDCSADPFRIAEDLSRDPDMAKLVALYPGLRVPGAWDGFEIVVRAVLGQQITVKGAVTIAGRLVRAFGRPLAGAAREGLTHVFPRPEDLADADLEKIGIPRARAEAIRSIARMIHGGELVLDVAGGAADPVSRLAGVPGIGRWTAGYIAMRALGEPDAYPYGDLGLRLAMDAGGIIPSAKELEHRSESWRPWRAYATVLLWMHAAFRRSESRTQPAEAARASGIPTGRKKSIRRRIP